MLLRRLAGPVLAAFVVTAAPPSARAQEPGPPEARAAEASAAPVRTFELTPYVGYRTGGDADGEEGSLDFDDAASFGAALEYVLPTGGRVGLLYSRHATSVVSRPRGGTEPESSLDVTIQWAQLAASTDFKPAGALRPFVSASVGGAYFDPAPDGAEGDWNAAGSVGAGVRTTRGDRVRARLEARVLGTFLDASSRVFCSLPGACAVSVNGELLAQLDVSIGLTLAF